LPELTVGQPNHGFTLHLAPTARSVQLLQARKHTDSPADSYRLDSGDLADDLEGHAGSYLSETGMTSDGRTRGTPCLAALRIVVEHWS
jgi:hypothetical protein